MSGPPQRYLDEHNAKVADYLHECRVKAWLAKEEGRGRDWEDW